METKAMSFREKIEAFEKITEAYARNQMKPFTKMEINALRTIARKDSRDFTMDNKSMVTLEEKPYNDSYISVSYNVWKEVYNKNVETDFFIVNAIEVDEAGYSATREIYRGTLWGKALMALKQDM